MLHRFSNQRIGTAHVLMKLKFAMARHGFDDDFAVVDGDAAEPFDMLDVDQDGWIGGAEVHCRHETLAAGKHHRVGVAGDGRDRFLDGPWRLVTKQRRLHSTQPPRTMYPNHEYDIDIPDALSINPHRHFSP